TSIRCLLLDLVHAVASLGLRGLDLEAVLLGGGREKPAYAGGPPVRGFHELGERRALGSPDQFQDLRALALGAGRLRLLGGGGLGSLFASLGVFLRRGGLGFAALGCFLALGRALLLAGTLLRGGGFRRNGRALFRNGGGCAAGGGIYVF